MTSNYDCTLFEETTYSKINVIYVFALLYTILYVHTVVSSVVDLNWSKRYMLL